MRISSPPVKWPCFYGIDFATRAELLANGLDIEGIRRSIGADSLGYVSLDGLIAATEQPKTRLCRACFDGEYPIELPADNLIGKHVLEGVGSGSRHAGLRRPSRSRAPSAAEPRALAVATPAAHRDAGTARHAAAVHHRSKGRTVTHVTERNSAGTSGAERRRPPAVDRGRRPRRPQAHRHLRRRRGLHPRRRAGRGAAQDARCTARTRPEVDGRPRRLRRPVPARHARSTSSPLLASSTDGVGTKLVIAQQMDIHDTVGIDLVAMVVDDLVACGAEPLFLLDYIACGEVVPDKVAEIGAGIADGCRYAGCALLGGETAEHPGVLRPRRVRHVGHRRRRGRGERDPRPRPGRGRRRRDRDALVRPALQRLLAGAARAARRRPDAAGHGDRGLRHAAHARRGAAHARPRSTPRTAST